MDILIVFAVFVGVCAVMLLVKGNSGLDMPDFVPEDSMLRRHFYTELEAKRKA